MVKLALTLLAISLMAIPAKAQTVNTFEGHLEIVIEEMAQKPYAGEMVLVFIRGRYPDGITLESLEKPKFDGMTWMELGVDSWSDVRYAGRRWRAFERRMALFPEQEGTITIPAFTHHLTFANRSGQRKEVAFHSEPVQFSVAPKPTTDAWWLPARDLRVADSWADDPTQLDSGEIAERTVTIEALGIGPEGLPPIPQMRAPGLMTFPQPEKREFEVTPEGPIARVTWVWKMRPATSTPGLLEAVVIPWFNTQTRTEHEVIIAPQRIAIVGADVLGHWEGALATAPKWSGLTIGAVTALLFGMAWIVPGLSLRGSTPLRTWIAGLRPDNRLKDLRKAARNGDLKTFRHAISGLKIPVADLPAEIKDLDRFLYGTDLTRPNHDLRQMAKKVAGLYRARQQAERSAS